MVGSVNLTAASLQNLKVAIQDTTQEQLSEFSYQTIEAAKILEPHRMQYYDQLQPLSH